MYLLVLYRCKWVRVNGITYKLNCAVVCAITDEETTFGKVKNVYNMDCNQVVFEIQKLNNKGFNPLTANDALPNYPSTAEAVNAVA